MQVFIGPPYKKRFKENFYDRKWVELPEHWAQNFEDLLVELGLKTQQTKILTIQIEFLLICAAGLYCGRDEQNTHFIRINEGLYYSDDDKELNLTLVHELNHAAWNLLYHNYCPRVPIPVNDPPVTRRMPRISRSSKEEQSCKEMEEQYADLKLLDFYTLKIFLRTGFAANFPKNYSGTPCQGRKKHKQLVLPFV